MLVGRCWRRGWLTSARAFSAASLTPAMAEAAEVKKEEVKRDNYTPREMVEYLDRFIVGQKDAKRAVANALRARWRRQRLPEDERREITPRNILMLGPTGCGKTEVARRLSKLVDAPFIKVEATKFTEVGFHGRDVDQIMRDLVASAYKTVRAKMEQELEGKVQAQVEEALLKALLGKAGPAEDK